MKWIDLPPVWLLAFLCVSWGSAEIGIGWIPGTAISVLGIVSIGSGIALMVLAVLEFAKARTTVIPHQEPSALVKSGVLGVSRNPIYLGDALVLTGGSLLWGSLIGLLLVPVFMWIIEVRFIRGEEDRLRQAFPEEFTRYESSVSRWI